MSKTTKVVCNNEEFGSSSSTSSSLSSDEEVNAQDLKPIKDYMPDRKELGRQLFKSVKPEKIRMMLPQTLKQMDLSELEQWCISELSGMSKKRILSILNGKPLLESSDTNESDNSGPSLEIISDTEEWLTDDDTLKKEDNGKAKLKRDKTKIKGKAQINKKNLDLDKLNVKAQCNNKNENINKIKDLNIKKDNDKEKEGDSLLDLLELEMRARAIRALIRKEEDIIPSVNPSQINNSEITDNNVKILPQNDIQVKENCRKQLERIINVKQGNIGEDEDVVLVIQPMPVIELLSSDSDGETHGGTRINQRLQNERVTKTAHPAENSNTNARNSNTINAQKLKEKKETQGVTGIHNNVATTVDTNRCEERTKILERNVDIKNNILSISISADNIAEKRKKSKKKSRTKSHVKTPICSTNGKPPKLKKIETSRTKEQTNDTKAETINIQSAKDPIDDEPQNVTAKQQEITKENVSKKSRVERERPEDLDEIIDLDDYCDDMDMENCDDDKSREKAAVHFQQDNKLPVSQIATNPQKSDSLETWASRYYQTDDVQNVIKESKIQSEIRKRLRERQRLSKLRKSPNLNLSTRSPASNVINAPEKTPTGSVEEYLALKRTTSTNINTNDSNTNINTTQDNVAAVDPGSDINVKENLMQDESNVDECTDSIDDTKNAAISESLIAEKVEAVPKNDIQSS